MYLRWNIKWGLFLVVFLVETVFSQLGFQNEQQMWYKANELADRLNGEGWKFIVVKKEIGRLNQVIEDLQVLRQYPGNLTGISSEVGKSIKEDLEDVRKNAGKALQILADLERPQEDAILISLEMLKESPNLDMIEILIQDNFYRIKDLVVVKKYVDKQWDLVTQIMEKIEKSLGLKIESAQSELFEDTFFKVLISQLGQASEVFYERYHNYKDSLVSRTQKASWEFMAATDLGAIQNFSRTREPEALQRDLIRLAQRYQHKLVMGGVYHQLGLSYYQQGEYEKAAEAFRKVGEGSEYFGRAKESLLRSFFELEEYDSVVVQHTQMDSLGLIAPGQAPGLRYLLLQSYYQLGNERAVGETLLKFGAKDEVYFRAYLVYAKSLVRQKRDLEASKVYKSIINQGQLPEKFRREALLQLGYLKYEQEYYESAISDFKILIDKPGFEDRALFGMVWCYVKMKDMKTAEFTLKKLINQYPDSPLALEGLMVLSKWRFIKAQKLWSYKLNTEKNKMKLSAYQQIIDHKIETGAIANNLADEVKRKLSIVELNLSSRVPVQEEEITSLFFEALKLIGYIPKHYQSGEYSEMTFSNDREKAIQKLRELLNKSVSARKSGSANPLSVKLLESQTLSLDMHVQLLDWKVEYQNYLQEKLAHHVSQNQPKESAHYQSALGEIRESSYFLFEAALKIAEELLHSPEVTRGRDRVIFYKGLILYRAQEFQFDLNQEKRAYLSKKLGADFDKLERDEKTFGQVDFEKVWNFLLDEYPESEYVPAAKFYLGYTKYIQGDPQGIMALQDFAGQYDSSVYYSRALSIIGDYYFEKDEYPIAMDSYLRVLDDPASAYFEKSLYQLAWTYYQAEDYPLALKTFSFILEHELNLSDAEKDSVLLEESLKMVAFSFAEMDTSQGVEDEKIKSFVEGFSEPMLGASLLHRAAIIFRKQGRLEKTKRVLDYLLKNYEAYGNMPEAMMDLSVAYEIESKTDRALEIREEIFEKFNRESSWYKSLLDQKHREAADSICELALNKIAGHYFSQAKLANVKYGKLPPGSIANKDLFMKAIIAYERFLSLYPKSKNANKFYYKLAESYFAIKKYYDAALLYMKASHTTDTEIKTAASYNAIIAAEKFYESKK